MQVYSIVTVSGNYFFPGHTTHHTTPSRFGCAPDVMQPVCTPASMPAPEAETESTSAIPTQIPAHAKPGHEVRAVAQMLAMVRQRLSKNAHPWVPGRPRPPAVTGSLVGTLAMFQSTMTRILDMPQADILAVEPQVQPRPRGPGAWNPHPGAPGGGAAGHSRPRARGPGSRAWSPHPGGSRAFQTPRVPSPVLLAVCACAHVVPQVSQTWLCLVQTRVVGIAMSLFREVLHFAEVVIGRRATLADPVRWNSYLLKCTVLISQCTRFMQEARRRCLDRTDTACSSVSAGARASVGARTSTATDHALVTSTDTVLTSIVEWMVQGGPMETPSAAMWVDTVFMAAARLRAVSPRHPSTALTNALFALDSQITWHVALLTATSGPASVSTSDVDAGHTLPAPTSEPEPEPEAPPSPKRARVSVCHPGPMPVYVPPHTVA